MTYKNYLPKIPKICNVKNFSLFWSSVVNFFGEFKIKMKGINEVNYAVSYFADGTVVPDLLTEEEAVKFLRLDECNSKKPEMTLAYYRSEGLLRGTKVGKRLRYLKSELLNFLAVQTNKTSGDIS